MPASRAAPTMPSASLWSMRFLTFGLKFPVPRVMAPNARRETTRPVRPRTAYFIRTLLSALPFARLRALAELVAETGVMILLEFQGVGEWQREAAVHHLLRPAHRAARVGGDGGGERHRFALQGFEGHDAIDEAHAQRFGRRDLARGEA